MPEIARPYGILIKQYAGDHSPPHFHVICGDDHALFDVETLEMIAGHLPVRAKSLVVEWATLTQAVEDPVEDSGAQTALNVMRMPRIVSVEPLANHCLIVTFTDGRRKRYDVTPLLDDEVFAPLRDQSLFGRVAVEQGGYAVSWNADIDLSEHELWQHGEDLP
ncbi:DUF2442 domain-containing protein [uncultured Lamprocystis sp.]|jgi:hypothetical protein|uniref:DUF2442 domain-containing protein n=1 Tax=uncultured Lamprocystis sp. TaxID=543132 RepID=UPI0025F1889F|nr:DUF2442 domain-containing protein [uncultured Lamprocystis sp.]